MYIYIHFRTRRTSNSNQDHTAGLASSEPQSHRHQQ